MTQDTSTEAPLIDSHAHVYTTDMPLSPTAWHKPPADATIDRYIATLDQHGVKYAVLAAASLFDDYNEYSIEDSMRYEYAIASFRQWVPDANMRRIISGETAFRLYFA